MFDEILDLVDEHDQIIGQKNRIEIYKQQLKNFRVINAFIINNQKKIWIPRRSPHKKLFPLCLDASVGGHVIAGESYDQAFARETMEELNINISTLNHMFLAKLTPHEHNVSAYMHVYIIHSDIVPTYNEDDFVSASWFDIVELQEMIKKGEKTKGDLPILIQTLNNLIR